jgi:hypothetical protein
MNSSDDSNAPPEFDHEFANAMVGKRILVGVTIEDRRGEFKRQEQFHGLVVEASQEQGFLLELQGTRVGETKWLPPATNYYKSAAPGIYNLRSTGESVADPDFTCTWLLIQPDA